MVLGGEHEAPAGDAPRARPRRFGLVRGEVVEHGDHVLIGGDLGFELVEEGDEVELVAGRSRPARDLARARAARRRGSGCRCAGTRCRAGRAGPEPAACRGGRARGRRSRSSRRPRRRSRWPADRRRGRRPRGLGVEVRAELAHHPVLGQMRAQIGFGQDRLGARDRHADLPGELGQRPAVTSQALLGVGRAGARQRDKARPNRLVVGHRPPGLGAVAQPVEPLTLIACALTPRGLSDTPDPLGDLTDRAALGGQQHDLCALDQAPLGRARADQLLQRRAVLRRDLDPLRVCSHVRLHRRPTRTTRRFNTTTTTSCKCDRTCRRDH